MDQRASLIILNLLQFALDVRIKRSTFILIHANAAVTIKYAVVQDVYFKREICITLVRHATSDLQ